MHFFQRHIPLEIFLVAKNEVIGIRRSLKCHVIPYIFEIIPGIRVTNVEYEDNSLAGLEVGGHNGSKFLLASSIPNAELDIFVMELH